MAAVLYFLTAAALLALAHRFMTRLTRGAAIALLLLPLCFTGRALLTNRIYAPVEMPYMTHPFVDHVRDLGVGKPRNAALADIAFQMIPWREATRRAIAGRAWPLLNPYELCGDMLAGSGQAAVYSPFTLIALLLPVPVSFTYTAAIALFVAGLGAFLLARELGCSVAASMFAAAGWMLSAPVALQILWPLGFAWTLLPFILAAVHRQSVPLIAIAFSLEILAGHPETMLHVTAIAFVFALVLKPSVRTFMAAAAGGVLALAVTAIHTLPFFDAAHQTLEYLIRRDLFAKAPLRVPAGYARLHLLGDLFPWLRPERVNLPGDALAGSIVFALAVYAVVFVRSKRVVFFAILGVACALVGAQAWPLAQALHAIPFFSQTLNERMATAVPLALAILAAFAIDRLELKRLAIVCAAIAIVYATVGFALPGDVPHLLFELVPLVLAAALALYPRAALPALFTLVLVQRIATGGSLIPTNEKRIAYPRFAIFQPLEKIAEPFRIVGSGNVLIPNTATMYGLEDVRGNSPMTLVALFETYPMWSEIAPSKFHSVPDVGRPFLSMMNVRFALLDVSEPIPPGWRDVTYDVWTRLVENEHVLPRAFVPRHVRFGRSPQQELDEMRAETDFAERAWLRIGNTPEERTNGGGTAAIRRAKNGLRLDITKEGDGFVVVSEAAWDGWRAYLDGQRVTLHRANHAFLAVFVPDGHHRVELRFLPQSFVIGRAISFGTLALLIGYCVIRRLR